MARNPARKVHVSTHDHVAFNALLPDVEFQFSEPDKKNIISIAGVRGGAEGFIRSVEELVARYLNAISIAKRNPASDIPEMFSTLAEELSSVIAGRKVIEKVPSQWLSPTLSGRNSKTDLLLQYDAIIVHLERVVARWMQKKAQQKGREGRPAALLADQFVRELERVWTRFTGRVANRSRNKDGFLNFVDAVVTAANLGEHIYASRVERLLRGKVPPFANGKSVGKSRPRTK